MVVTFVAKFVNAAGLPAHDAFVCVAVLVRPLTVTVQVAVVAAIVTAVMPDSTRVPLLYALSTGPLQPAL